MNRTIEFVLPKAKVLNSNTMTGMHFIVKGRATEALRAIAVEEGLKHHPVEQHPALALRLDAIKDAGQQKILKGRMTKALKKEGGKTAAEIKEEVEAAFADDVLVDPESFEIPRLFKNFKILITVAVPTRRRFDPVNIYPTVKALIDGLTDVAWWEDDDFGHLCEVSFRYGGLSGDSAVFKLTMSVDEIEDTTDYVLEAEVVPR